jgi:hypothetical protein
MANLACGSFAVLTAIAISALSAVLLKGAASSDGWNLQKVAQVALIVVAVQSAFWLSVFLWKLCHIRRGMRSLVS